MPQDARVVVNCSWAGCIPLANVRSKISERWKRMGVHAAMAVSPSTRRSEEERDECGRMNAFHSPKLDGTE